MNYSTKQVIIGAFVAALMLFLTSIVTLFSQDADLTFDTIKQSAWVSMVGGAVLQALKDYYAVAFRNMIAPKE